MAWIALLGAGHFILEIACSFSLTQAADNSLIQGEGILAFNLLAFVLQPFIGLCIDRWRLATLSTLLGGILIVAALLLPGFKPEVLIVLLGLGNGCFHVGAGTWSIMLSRGRLVGLGMFVGPGALGLTLGVGLARTDTPFPAAIISSLFIMILVGVWLLGRRHSTAIYSADRGREIPNMTKRALTLTLLLLLSCIAIRSFVGLGLGFDWNSSATTAVAIGLALASGKIAGGWLADRFGWIQTSILVLALSVPALWFGRHHVFLGLLGTALFQTPMAITLGALVWQLPTYPGFAFGLASAAVYGGAFFLTGETPHWVQDFHTHGLLSTISIGLLVVALRDGSKMSSGHAAAPRRD